MGRPAGREGAATIQSSKAVMDTETPKASNPTGAYRVGASLQILQEQGKLSHKEKRALYYRKIGVAAEIEVKCLEERNELERR